MQNNKWLIIGGTLSVIAALLHLAAIIGGPDWYRFFGAGEEIAVMAERGSLYPAVLTIGIASILLVWAAYAFAGAGLLRRLPLMRTALIVISAIYLLRGFALLPLFILRPALVDSFAIWSSLIVLVYGIAYAVGTRQSWAALSEPRSARA